MDTRNGNIMTEEMAKLLNIVMRRKVTKIMTIPPTNEQMIRRPPRVGRNDSCPCGSGLKFKKCCLNINA